MFNTYFDLRFEDETIYSIEQDDILDVLRLKGILIAQEEEYSILNANKKEEIIALVSKYCGISETSIIELNQEELKEFRGY